MFSNGFFITGYDTMQYYPPSSSTDFSDNSLFLHYKGYLNLCCT